MGEIFLPQGTPLTIRDKITADWYVPLQQLATQALTFNGHANPGDTIVFVNNTEVTTGPPVSTLTSLDVLAWLGL